MNVRKWMTGAVLLAAAYVLAAQDSPGADVKPSLVPDAEYPALVDASVKVIQSALAGQPNKRMAGKAHVAAIMLAEFAQQDFTGTEGGRRATMRDSALEIAGLIKKLQYAEALKQAEALPKLSASAKAKKEKVKLLGPLLEVDDLMSQFRSTKVGGLGIEMQLDELGNVQGGAIPAEKLNDQVRLLAYQSAIAAELAKDHKPSMDSPAWQKFAESMRQASGDLVKAVKAKDGKTAFVAVGKLNTSCNECHKKFR